MEVLIIIFLILCLTAAGYSIMNLLTKLEKYEDFIESETQKNQALLEALREIDSRQMFEKDDDVGSIFYQIKETIEKFKQFN
jgi:hypothetical protein